MASRQQIPHADAGTFFDADMVSGRRANWLDHAGCAARWRAQGMPEDLRRALFPMPAVLPSAIRLSGRKDGSMAPHIVHGHEATAEPNRSDALRHLFADARRFLLVADYFVGAAVDRAHSAPLGRGGVAPVDRVAGRAPRRETVCALAHGSFRTGWGQAYPPGRRPDGHLLKQPIVVEKVPASNAHGKDPSVGTLGPFRGQHAAGKTRARPSYPRHWLIED
jgi:hypothetical protein